MQSLNFNRASEVSPPPSRNEIEQNEIDMGIAHLYESIRNFRTRRNRLSLISTLPFELLSAIFLECVLSAPNSNAMLQIAQVCRDWLQVAVDSALLWTKLDPGRLHPVVVSRSGQAPIHLQFQEIHGTVPRSAERFISENFHRVQDLSLQASAESIDTLLKTTTGYAPLLEAVKISAWSENRYVHPSLSALFNGGAPRLKRLTLEHMRIDWSWDGFSQLTHLRIRVQAKSRSGLFSVLRRMPHLLYLDLEESLPDCSTEHPKAIEPSTIVDLPNLQELKLDDASLWNCTFFLHHLRIPSTTRINLHIWVGPHGQGVVQATLAVESDSLPPALCPPGDHLEVSWAEDALCFARWPTVQLRLEGGCTGTCFAAALPAITQPSVLKYLHVYMSYDHYWSELDWTAALGQLRDLVRIDFTMNQSGRALFRAMAEHISAAGSIVLLPSLRELVITATKNMSYFAIIESTLRFRIASGARILKVKILMESKADEMDSTEMEELSRLVDVFEVCKI